MMAAEPTDWLQVEVWDCGNWYTYQQRVGCRQMVVRPEKPWSGMATVFRDEVFRQLVNSGKLIAQGLPIRRGVQGPKYWCSTLREEDGYVIYDCYQTGERAYLKCIAHGSLSRCYEDSDLSNLVRIGLVDAKQIIMIPQEERMNRSGDDVHIWCFSKYDGMDCSMTYKRPGQLIKLHILKGRRFEDTVTSDDILEWVLTGYVKIDKEVT